MAVILVINRYFERDHFLCNVVMFVCNKSCFYFSEIQYLEFKCILVTSAAILSCSSGKCSMIPF